MKTDFRQQLVNLMKAKKVSIAKASRLADLNANTLYKYFRGESQLRADNVEKLLDLLQKI